ncbi:MAG: ATP-dependent DNA helicase PcrA, partial [Sphingobacteriaceae bacterium]
FSQNICCVGDEDQSIYGWRGAEIGNILRFEKDFPNAKVIRLEQNYRSTNHILAAASKLISNNKERLGKTLWTENYNDEKVKLVALFDDREEARFVAKQLTNIVIKDQIPFKNTAILVRAGFQTRSFEECFISNYIPYKVVGGLRFYERMEIRDIIAYIRVTINNDDD